MSLACVLVALLTPVVVGCKSHHAQPNVRSANEASPQAADPSAQVVAEPDADSESVTAEQLLLRASQDQRDSLELLRRMCIPAIGAYATDSTLAGEVVLGCACCAPFEGCLPGVGTSALRVQDPWQIYSLRHWHEGSFTGPGESQLAVTLDGCEPGAENRGGTMVFDQRGKQLEQRLYRSGINPDGCRRLAATPDALRAVTDHDLLVCWVRDGMGSSWYTRLLLVDLAAGDAKDSSKQIDDLHDDAACLKIAGEAYVNLHVRAYALLDEDQDGDLDLVLEVGHRSGHLSADDLASCDDDSPNPRTLPAPTPARLVYNYKNGSFLPSKNTDAFLRKLYAGSTFSYPER